MGGSDAAKLGDSGPQGFIVRLGGGPTQADTRRYDIGKGLGQPLWQAIEI